MQAPLHKFSGHPVLTLTETAGQQSCFAFNLNFIIHQTHYEKSDWSRAFTQFTIACELDMINAISAADIAFNVCLVTKPLGVFSETKWLNALLLLTQTSVLIIHDIILNLIQ